MADFGKILDEWERRAVRDFRRPVPSNPTEAGKIVREDSARRMLERALLESGDPGLKSDETLDAPRVSKAQVEALPVDAVLDLHGLTAAGAEESLSRFFRDAASRGLAKVLVIHGKGNHSEGEPVLKRTVLRFLETSPLAGRHGTADRRLGGGGAVWVLLKTSGQRSR